MEHAQVPDDVSVFHGLQDNFTVRTVQESP